MSTDPGAFPGSTPPPRPGWPGPRKLVRYPDQGPLGGVCAGLAHYLNVDPTVVRIAAVVLAFTGPGIPAYILAWIFVPADDGHVMAPWPHTGVRRGDHTSRIVGIALIAIVISVLWGDWWRPHAGWFVPVGLIGVGAWLLLRDHDDAVPPVPPPPPTAGPPPPWQPTPPTPPTSVLPAPVPPAGSTEPSAPTDPPETNTDMDAELTEDTPGDTALDDHADAPTEPFDTTQTTAYTEGTTSWGPTPPGEGPPPPAGTGAGPPDPLPPGRPRRRRIVGPVVFGALLLWTGIACLTGIGAQDGLAVGLCLVGVGFVVSAFTGGSKGLILPALLVGALLVAVTTVDVPIGSGVGDRQWTVTSLGELDSSYELGIGEATLDLRDLPLGDRSVDIDVKVGIGHLLVYVPESAAVFVNTEVAIGESNVLGHDENGTSIETYRVARGAADAGQIHLHLRLGVGKIEVHRGVPTIEDRPNLPTPPTTATPPTTPTTPTTPTSALVG
jgi:phage shock protein PspC (stress-responsive transcriptional regulator)